MNERFEVDFEPEGEPSRRGGHRVLWAMAAILAVVLAVLIFRRALPFFLAVLGASAVLAAFSTWHAARRRALMRSRLGAGVPRVGPGTYLWHLVAWFIGLLAAAPLIFVGLAVAIVALIFIGIVALILLIAALFHVR